MLPTVRTAAITAVTALTLALGSVAPAQALGKNEKNFLKGVAATLLVTTIINDQRARGNRQYVQPRQPVYAAPVYAAPVYQQPQPVYQQPVYQQPVYQQPRGQVVSLYSTPAAAAFNSYSTHERRAIQQRLAAAGYYRSGIDGSFGPGTYKAVTAYARDSGGDIGTRAGAFGVYDELIF